MEFKDLKIPDCKNYSGYKPCISYKNCLENGCQMHNDDTRTGHKILIISLDALGNVLLNTSILHSIKQKYPISTVYWITMKNARPILANNPYVDFVYQWDDESRMVLKNIFFDVLLNSDKSQYACSFANEINSREKFGFLLNENGQIVPSNEEALYNYQMGIDDELKFRINVKPGSQIIHETFKLNYNRDEYIFSFDDAELEFIQKYKEQINISGNRNKNFSTLH